MSGMAVVLTLTGALTTVSGVPPLLPLVAATDVGVLTGTRLRDGFRFFDEGAAPFRCHGEQSKFEANVLSPLTQSFRKANYETELSVFVKALSV